MVLRYTHEDIAKRYIRMYGGKLDCDMPYGDYETKIYLFNVKGEEIAIVEHGDYYPKVTIKDYELDPNDDIPY